MSLDWTGQVWLFEHHDIKQVVASAFWYKGFHCSSYLDGFADKGTIKHLGVTVAQERDVSPVVGRLLFQNGFFHLSCCIQLSKTFILTKLLVLHSWWGLTLHYFILHWAKHHLSKCEKYGNVFRTDFKWTVPEDVDIQSQKQWFYSLPQHCNQWIGHCNYSFSFL